MQPELASGIRTSPPAGMMFIQQPGRVALLRRVGPPSGVRSYIHGLCPLQNIAWDEADTPPQPWPCLANFHPSMRLPVFNSYAYGQA